MYEFRAPFDIMNASTDAPEAFRRGRLSRHELIITAVSPPIRRAGSRSVDALCDEHHLGLTRAISGG